MDCRDLLETDRVRTDILNVADSKETSARLSLGERRMDEHSASICRTAPRATCNHYTKKAEWTAQVINKEWNTRATVARGES